MANKKPNHVSDLFEEAINNLRKGDTRRALHALFKLFRLDPCHKEALMAASKLVTFFNDIRGAELLRDLSESPENVDLLYETGYHFINMGQPDVAKSFLETCLRHTGDNPDVLYELGYCNYLDQKYSRAANILKKAAAGLDPERSMAAELLMIECMLYAGKADEGMRMLKDREPEYRKAGRSDTAEAMELMYSRYQQAHAPLPYDLRTWHFIKHGGVILAASGKGKSHGLFETMSMNLMAVGALLRLLKAVVEGVNLEIEAILHLDGDSHHLALATGSLLSRPVRHWDNRSGNKELLVAPNMEAIELSSLHPVTREELAYLFCFHVFPLREYLILPDIVGLMSMRFRFPWQERVEIITSPKEEPKARTIPADLRDPEVIGQEIADAARMLPDDSNAPKLIEFYRKHRDLLVLCNEDKYPERRFFNPLTPA